METLPEITVSYQIQEGIVNYNQQINNQIETLKNDIAQLQKDVIEYEDNYYMLVTLPEITTPCQMKRFVQGEPWLAAKYLKDHPLLTKEHVDYIAEHDPSAVAIYLKNHPLLTKETVADIVKRRPCFAKQLLEEQKDSPSEYEELFQVNIPSQY